MLCFGVLVAILLSQVTMEATGTINHSKIYSPVICIPGPIGAGDSGGKAGRKCHNLTSNES